MWESAVFCIVVSDAPSCHHRGVALFYKKLPYFTVEDQKQPNPNVISFQMVAGRQRCHVADFYLPVRDTSTLERIATAISHRPRGAELLITGDFNTDLEFPDGN